MAATAHSLPDFENCSILYYSLLHPEFRMYNGNPLLTLGTRAQGVTVVCLFVCLSVCL